MRLLARPFSFFSHSLARFFRFYQSNVNFLKKAVEEKNGLLRARGATRGILPKEGIASRGMAEQSKRGIDAADKGHNKNKRKYQQQNG